MGGITDSYVKIKAYVKRFIANEQIKNTTKTLLLEMCKSELKVLK